MDGCRVAFEQQQCVPISSFKRGHTFWLRELTDRRKVLEKSKGSDWLYDL